MPQLDVASFSTQLFWLAIFFAGFTWCMWRLVVPGIKKSLDSRTLHFSALSDKSMADQEKANALLKESEEKLAKSRAEISVRYKEISSDLAKDLSKKRSKLGIEYKAKIRENFQLIQQDAAEAEKEIIANELKEFVKLAYERVMSDVK